MSSNRVFYAVHGIGFKGIGIPGKVPLGGEAHGIQSIGLNTTFNLEQVFELGQIEIYENVENRPDVEITVEKALDDDTLVYHLATSGSTGATLTARTTLQTIAVIPIYPDTYDSCSGDASNVVTCSGMYVSSLAYNFPVDGTATESVTLIGSDKVWSSDGTSHGLLYSFDNDDEPGSAGIQRREDVVMGTGTAVDGNNSCTFPTEIPGIDANGKNPLNAGGTAYDAHVQSVSCSVDLGREDLYELGRKGEYYKFVNFPVEVTTTIELTATDEGDSIDAAAEGTNVTDQTIKVVTLDNTQVYLGTKNKLGSISQSGGDSSGGSVSVSLTYTGYNTFTVTNPSTDCDGHSHV